MSGDIRLNEPVFLAMSYLTLTNKPCQLWSYWTEFHKILTRFRGIICAVNANIEIAIAHSVLELQSDKCRGVGNFASFLPLNWLPWQRPLRYWKNNLRSIIYTQHPFIRYKNCKNRTWFVFCLWHKIGCHGNVPCGIWKTGPDQENSHKYLPFGEKIVKIGLVDHEIALLNLKKRKKLTQAKYIARSAT